MAKTKDQKKQVVDKLTEKFKASKSIVFSEIKGLNVADTSALRKQLREGSVQHTVVKLTLLKLALRKAGIKVDDFDFKTQVAVSFSEDEVAAAKILKSFAKKNENLKMLSGYLEGKRLSEVELNNLASLPSKTELLGQLVSVLSGPSRGLVTVLSGNLRGLVQVLSQIKKN